MKNSTYYKLETMVYKMRERMGDKDPLACRETGEKWNNSKHQEFVGSLLTLRRLALKHHRLAEMDCNGEGVIRGVHYYNGTIDDYARGVKSAYVSPDLTIFTKESDKVEDKIKALCDKQGITVEFQGDPRGYTCKFFFQGQFLDVQQ